MYLLKYFIPYKELVRLFFDDYIKRKKIDINKDLTITLLASGAAPELLGIVEALKENGFNHNLCVHCLDSEDSWSDQLKDFASYTKTQYKNLSVDYYYECDLTCNCPVATCSLSQVCESDIFTKTDFFFMINLLNHVDGMQALENIINKVNRIKSGSQFIIMDSRYKDSSMRWLNEILLNTTLCSTGIFTEHFIYPERDSMEHLGNYAKFEYHDRYPQRKYGSLLTTLSYNGSTQITKKILNSSTTQLRPTEKRKWIYLVYCKN